MRESGLTQEDLAKVAQDAATFGELDTLDGDVVGPIPSEDGQAAQTIVPLNLGSEGWSLAADAVADLRATAEEGADGLQVYVTGPAGSAADSSEAFEGIDSTLLYAAAGVVIVILLLTYRSPTLWLLPVISAGVALTVSQAVVYVLADNTGLTVNAQSAGILTVLVFGAGTDYALLLVARYREELRRHEDRHEAMALALHRAGPAIVASGATVALGMLCLLFAQMSSTAGLGPVAAVGIVVALLVMLTLLPALLVATGRWVFWPRVPHLGDDEPTEHGVWARLGARISRRRGACGRDVRRARSPGPGDHSARRQRIVERRVVPRRAAVDRGRAGAGRALPGGSGSPVVVVADDSSATAVAEVRDAFAGTEGSMRPPCPSPCRPGATSTWRAH
ncbi:MMPL family transporter [Oerskovia sp. M15]